MTQPNGGKTTDDCARARTRANYDRLSRFYDAISGAFEKGPKDLGLTMLAVHEGERVLEIGFGTGYALLHLARAVGETGRVYGIELSDGMRRVTFAKVERAGLAGRVQLDLGDAAHLPYDDDTLDAVFMSFTLELFNDAETPLILGKCRRVLRLGGRICVAGMSRLGKANLVTRLYAWSNRRFPGIVDCRPILIQDLLQAAGFLVLGARLTAIAGLPVEVVLARKDG